MYGHEVMKKRTRKPPQTLQDWMERTGTSTSALARKAQISQPHMSRILTGSRRCSLEKAIRLFLVTGVPVQNLCRWPVHDHKAEVTPAA